ncbi:biotin synthase [Rhodoferax sp.]|uniref:biotin synthase n=1 Tax=Rhodoferax sp. TaxID=50421 RepID=UPI00271C4929|nr:biotin synthase [Rhodoferax sp.]MDO9195160.1 biotin synthase [Rhodoferax sp.]
MTTQRPPTIDPQAVRRWQQMPAGPSPWLHEEVARRMEERLEWIKLKPENWAHWEPVRGGLQAHALLNRRYPDAGCFVVEADKARTAYAAKKMASPWWQPSRWTGTAPRFEAPTDGAVQMLWANMALHMAADPQGLMAQWHRALAVDGFVMFSCLGPDTLQELRGLYQSLGWPAPSHEFTDMHDWGDMLVATGFAEPVMDMERITLTFETPQRLLEELRGLGRNLNSQRFPAMRGRQWHGQLHQALAGAPLRLTFEVIYGHAFKPRPRLPIRPETVLSLAEMRETLNQRKR